MKIQIRNNVFETNSSSTHSVTLIDTKTKFKKETGDFNRKIVSKKHKLIFLASVTKFEGNQVAYSYKRDAEEKGKKESEINLRVEEIKQTYSHYQELMIDIYCNLSKEDKNAVTEMINEETSDKYSPAFLEYFNNDTLDGFYGSHLSVARHIFKKPNDDYSLTEKLKNYFDDTVYIQLVENWFGGGDRNLPEEF